MKVLGDLDTAIAMKYIKVMEAWLQHDEKVTDEDVKLLGESLTEKQVQEVDRLLKRQ